MEDDILKQHVEDIRRNAKGIGRDVRIMEICGGHTNVIMRYGIRSILPENIHLISGPGCPVCVSSQKDIDCMIEIAKSGIPVATYGDMIRVPGSRSSLEDQRGEGAKVYEVYSATEVLGLKKKHPDIIFFGIGFETTAPMTAFLLKNGIAAYSVHKKVVPAMQAILEENVRIDGFLDPGHVSTIIGSDAYHDIMVPQAVAGFSAERVLRAISILTGIIKEGKDIVVNCYPEAVSKEGNLKAKKMIDLYFRPCDSEWRGLGIIKGSGLEVKEEKLNAKIIHEDIIRDVKPADEHGCRCGDVLKGVIEPERCGLFGRTCTPKHPVGPCMVSSEGSCSISYNYSE